MGAAHSETLANNSMNVIGVPWCVQFSTPSVTMAPFVDLSPSLRMARLMPFSLCHVAAFRTFQYLQRINETTGSTLQPVTHGESVPLASQ
jgi:hypothetical protein